MSWRRTGAFYIFTGPASSIRTWKPAVQAFVGHDEERLRGSLPARSVGPHERHRAQGECEGLVDWKSLDCCVWSQLEISAQEARANLFGCHCVLPPRRRRGHDITAVLAQVVTGLRDRVVVEVEQRERAVVVDELVVLEISMRGQPLLVDRDARPIAHVGGEVPKQEMPFRMDVGELLRHP